MTDTGWVSPYPRHRLPPDPYSEGWDTQSERNALAATSGINYPRETWLAWLETLVDDEPDGVAPLAERLVDVVDVLLVALLVSAISVDFWSSTSPQIPPWLLLPQPNRLDAAQAPESQNKSNPAVRTLLEDFSDSLPRSLAFLGTGGVC